MLLRFIFLPLIFLPQCFCECLAIASDFVCFNRPGRKVLFLLGFDGKKFRSARCLHLVKLASF